MRVKICNSTIINVDKRDYLFRSFWDREDCYRILTVFWEKYKTGGPASISAMGRIRAVSQPPSVNSSVAATVPSNATSSENNSTIQSSEGAAGKRISLGVTN